MYDIINLRVNVNFNANLNLFLILSNCASVCGKNLDTNYKLFAEIRIKSKQQFFIDTHYFKYTQQETGICKLCSILHVMYFLSRSWSTNLSLTFRFSVRFRTNMPSVPCVLNQFFWGEGGFQCQIFTPSDVLSV
jgi:hypothetical protein